MLKLALLCLLFLSLWAKVSPLSEMRMNPEAGFRGSNGCLAKMDCATDKLPLGSDIVSVKLYHETASNGTRVHTLLAKAEDQSQMMFRDRVWLSNAGAFVTDNQKAVCPGTYRCMGTTTFFIYPIQEENLGEYMCETRVREGNQTLVHVYRATLAFDRCCKACHHCNTNVGGVWGSLGSWSPESCKGCSQERQPQRCLTQHCNGTKPVQRRHCAQDGVCDETDRIKIVTERVNAGRCRAKVQCKVSKSAIVTSVQLFHVWGPRRNVTWTGYTDLKYTGSILLAEAKAGVNEGRFTEKFSHPNGEVDPDNPSDPQLCSCTDNCKEFYTFTFDTVNPGNVGDYACVTVPNNSGFYFAARLDFSDDCPRPSSETGREENCEQNCLTTFAVESHEQYIRNYCHKFCEPWPQTT